MKTITALLAVLAFAGFSLSRTVDTPYVVTTWRGSCAAASTFTFDDGCAHGFSIAQPMFAAKNFKVTFYLVVTGGMFPGWAKLQSAAAAGHEVASHTMTHPTNLGTLTQAQQITELKNSRDSIRLHVPKEQCIDLAYPNCNPSTESITGQYYFAARNCSGQIVPKSPSDFFAISCFICGNTGSNTTAAALITLANNALKTNGWTVYLVHDIDSLDGHNHGGYSPTPEAALQGWVNYMDTNRTKFWVETFGNVVRYIKERDSVSVRGVSRTSDSIILSVTDGLNDTFFNYPITIQRPLPSGWQTVRVTQGATVLNAQTKDSNGVRYVNFDAVPDAGNVVVSRNSTNAYFALTRPQKPEDMKAFWRKDAVVISGLPASGRQFDITLVDLKGAQIAKLRNIVPIEGSILLPHSIVTSRTAIVTINGPHAGPIQRFLLQPRVRP